MRQRPSPFAAVVVVCSANETVTLSPGSAQPQTAIGFSRWRTMPSPKIFGRRTSAHAGSTLGRTRKSTANTHPSGFDMATYFSLAADGTASGLRPCSVAWRSSAGHLNRGNLSQSTDAKWIASVRCRGVV